ncbi:MAG: hypothetical protein GY929_21970 [Actinomycetia bacterium]|nr:hypothetical protein [Actinomycetes bacterium]
MSSGAPVAGRASESGSVALAQIAALVGVLLFVVLCAQVLLWGYGRAAVRAAAQEAVGQAARPGSSDAECEARFRTVVDGLLGGSLGDGVGPPVCRVAPERVVLEVDMELSGWLPGVPDWSQHLVAVARRHPAAEEEPG